jgi:hypothetical protein
MLGPSELARLTGVSTDTLPHYGRRGGARDSSVQPRRLSSLSTPSGRARATGATGAGHWLDVARPGGCPVGIPDGVSEECDQAVRPLQALSGVARTRSTWLRGLAVVELEEPAE